MTALMTVSNKNMIEYKLYNKEYDIIPLADGFFEGWPSHPDKATHRRILKAAYKSIVAIDTESNTIIGFINIISDGIMSAYIPLLEVIPQYRKKGIGKKLMELAIAECSNLYMIDLSCDENLVGFYNKFNMYKGYNMLLRNYNRQSCK